MYVVMPSEYVFVISWNTAQFTHIFQSNQINCAPLLSLILYSFIELKAHRLVNEALRTLKQVLSICLTLDDVN